MLEDGDAGSEGFAELTFEVGEVGGAWAIGGRGGAGASEAVCDQALGLADGEVLLLDAGGQTALLVAVGEAEQGAGVAHRECST